jgi:hypothetical protein
MVQISTATFNGGALSGTNTGVINIRRISGPATIAASEKVYAIATSANGQSCADGQTIEFEVIENNSHAAYSAATGIFIAPKSGICQVDAFITGNSTAQTAATFIQLKLVKNGSAVIRGQANTMDANHTEGVGAILSTSVYVNAGDTLKIVVANSTASSTLEASSEYNRISFIIS